VDDISIQCAACYKEYHTSILESEGQTNGADIDTHRFSDVMFQRQMFQ